MGHELVIALRERLNALHAEDLGVSPEDTLVIRSRSGIAYQEVYSGPEMTLCIFLLRKGAGLPLHDHPDMSVFGRLLFGRMRVLSFDFVEPNHRQPTSHLGAFGYAGVLQSDCTIGPEPTMYSLGPQEGNLHEITALDDCAFFD